MKIKSLLIQGVKYGIVGFLNTGITLLVIFILKDLIGLSIYIANITGYIAGLLNSFLWNRSWTFKSGDGHLQKQAISFMLVWLVCYLIQLGVLYICRDIILLGDYIAIFIGMVSYTAISFFLNRFITFKQSVRE